VSPNPEQLRRHYASLSDEELEAVEPNALTEVARTCYDTEMKRRGLSAAESSLDEAEGGNDEGQFEADGDAQPDADDESSLVSTFVDVPGSSSVADAEDAYRALSAAGIPCQVKVKDGELYPERQIIVPSSLNLRAISVLDKAISAFRRSHS
jgi:hypothetical protein